MTIRASSSAGRWPNLSNASMWPTRTATTIVSRAAARVAGRAQFDLLATGDLAEQPILQATIRVELFRLFPHRGRELFQLFRKPRAGAARRGGITTQYGDADMAELKMPCGARS